MAEIIDANKAGETVALISESAYNITIGTIILLMVEY